MPAYFKWHNFKGFFGLFLSVSGRGQHKKIKQYMQKVCMVPFQRCALSALCICFSICSPVVPN